MFYNQCKKRDFNVRIRTNIFPDQALISPRDYQIENPIHVKYISLNNLINLILR